MGFPMTYGRVVHRNGLEGRYCHGVPFHDGQQRSSIRGDLRRFEADARDPRMLEELQRETGVNPETALTVINWLLRGVDVTEPWCEPATACPANHAVATDTRGKPLEAEG